MRDLGIHTIGLGVNTQIIALGEVTSSLDTSTWELANAMTTPYNAYVELIDTAIRSLKSAGIFQKRDLIQVYAADKFANCGLNWRQRKFDASWPVPPTLSARGVTGNGSTMYGNSNFKGSDAKWGSGGSAASFSVWVDLLGNGVIAGEYKTTVPRSFMYIQMYAAATAEYIYFNGQQPNNSYNFASAGLITVTKSNENVIQLYFNGVAVGTPLTPTAQQDIFWHELSILAQNRMGVQYNYFNGRLSLMTYGDFLSPSEVLADYNVWAAFMAGVEASLSGDTYEELPAPIVPLSSVGLEAAIDIYQKEFYINAINNQRYA